MRVAAQVMLTAIERRRLETWASARSTTVRLVERSKIVLMACAGMPNQAIAKALGIDQNTVGRWRNRFVKERVKGIEKERPRGGNHGGKDSKRQAKLRARIIEATTQTTPKDATHWSTRTMARAMGTTHSVVHRVWQSHGLKPHLIRTFKVSNDPRFEEKLHDVVGLYLNPPENAVVFSVDEKSSVQALDRTQPGLPLHGRRLHSRRGAGRASPGGLGRVGGRGQRGRRVTGDGLVAGGSDVGGLGVGNSAGIRRRPAVWTQWLLLTLGARRERVLVLGVPGATGDGGGRARCAAR